VVKNENKRYFRDQRETQQRFWTSDVFKAFFRKNTFLNIFLNTTVVSPRLSQSRELTRAHVSSRELTQTHANSRELT
jgi:hypothetical protein